MIRLHNINKTYYTEATSLHVLKGIDLEIKKGEYVSIMGASGSGKSTLLNILGILDNYETGEYYLNDILIKDLTEKQSAFYRNELIGFVFQSFNLFGFNFSFTCGGNKMSPNKWYCYLTFYNCISHSRRLKFLHWHKFRCSRESVNSRTGFVPETSKGYNFFLINSYKLPLFLGTSCTLRQSGVDYLKILLLKLSEHKY